jgi:hypothetical protein
MTIQDLVTEMRQLVNLVNSMSSEDPQATISFDHPSNDPFYKLSLDTRLPHEGSPADALRYYVYAAGSLIDFAGDHLDFESQVQPAFTFCNEMSVDIMMRYGDRISQEQLRYSGYELDRIKGKVWL